MVINNHYGNPRADITEPIIPKPLENNIITQERDAECVSCLKMNCFSTNVSHGVCHKETFDHCMTVSVYLYVLFMIKFTCE